MPLNTKFHLQEINFVAKFLLLFVIEPWQLLNGKRSSCGRQYISRRSTGSGWVVFGVGDGVMNISQSWNCKIGSFTECIFPRSEL